MINQASVVHRLPSDPQTTLLSFNLDLQLFILILRVLISKSIPVNFGRKCDICAKYIFVRWEQNVTSDVEIFYFYFLWEQNVTFVQNTFLLGGNKM